ncbi:hypothetical protein BN2156_02619 [Mycolicibacterium neworleansense]|uniref:Uncharacterized protein n=1 Tax=Mycolicibacterium neworleansense TaxID=146018 RepID=A0A0H5RPL5_9MYCO|nr:hypothetical protein BN2156_02619 [Mycolicibacterium neworleansense]
MATAYGRSRATSDAKMSANRGVLGNKHARSRCKSYAHAAMMLTIVRTPTPSARSSMSNVG